MPANCCLCFPLECGMKTLAALTIIGALSGGINCFMNEGYCKVLWPILAAEGIMSILWIVALVSPSERTRHATFLGWIVLMIGVIHIYWMVIIFTGSLTGLYCEGGNIEFWQKIFGGDDPDWGVDECKRLTKIGSLVDWGFSFLLCLYWHAAILRWSHNDEAYQKA